MVENLKKNEKETELKKKAEEITNYLLSLDFIERSKFVENIKELMGIKSSNDYSEKVSSNNNASTQEEKKMFSLVLNKIGDQSLQIYRIIGEVLGKSLLEAKKMLITLPINILNNVPKEETEELKTRLEAQGANVEIK